jgi:ribosomal peptide maturation radical SAM protein 1
MACDVLLVNMPFGAIFRPSLGLAQLLAVLRQQGFTVRQLDATIRLAERIGHEVYVDLSNQRPLPTDAVGEWIFSAALFAEGAGPAIPGYDARRAAGAGRVTAVGGGEPVTPVDPGDAQGAAEPGRTPQDQAAEEAFVDGILRRRDPFYATPVGCGEGRPASAVFADNVRELRRMAPRFLDEVAAEALALEPRIVGFGSVFQQHVASLALARRLKALRPELVILFGGANCEGPMGAETARQFPFVDAVVSGEGEVVVPELVRRALAGESLGGLPGVFLGGEDHLSGRGSRPRLPNAVSPPDLDTVPMPDFSDYLANLRASRLDPRIQPLLLYETSRGCWWGAKSHCTFCGLNAQGMAFRSKSAPRVLAELVELAAAHPGSPVSIVDNILDMRYFKELLPELTARGLGLELFYEVKANLRKDQVRALGAAGIRGIQPGIESFSTPVLELMGKGVRAIQNVQLLKWCQELGVRPYWNVLWGFPGEPAEEYTRMGAVLERLVHLPPPMSSGRIRLDRFSPNYEQSDRLGFTAVRPYPAAYHVWRGLAPEAIANLAYYFAFDYTEPRQPEVYAAPVADAVARWKEQHEASGLFFVDDGEVAAVWDFRPCAVDRLTLLDGLERLVLTGADAVVSLHQLAVLAARTCGEPVGSDAMAAAARALEERGLLLREGDTVLTLAIAVGEYQPKAALAARWRQEALRLAPAAAVVLSPGSRADEVAAASS